MKIIFIFLIIFFFNLGIILDRSNKLQKKDAIFSLVNERSDRLIKSVNLYSQNYSTKSLIYFCTKIDVLKDFFKTRQELIPFKQYFNEINLMQFPIPLNTFEEILNIEKEMTNKNIRSAIIVTDPPHTLRVKIFIELFTTRLKEDYIIVSSEPEWWNKHLYFTNWYAFKFSLSELLKIPYNIIKYTLFSKYDIERSNQKI